MYISSIYHLICYMNKCYVQLYAPIHECLCEQQNKEYEKNKTPLWVIYCFIIISQL